MNAFVTFEKCMNSIGFVNARTVPYEDEGRSNLTPEGFQEFNCFCGPDVFINVKTEI
jgi:hypothetical protein